MACNYQYLEHGIGYNLRTFMSIINSGGIYSPAMAQHHRIPFMGSHVNPTGGDDLISVSIPETPSSRLYSSDGITFIIDTTGLQCASSPKGTPIVGETYIKNAIPLSSISRIYIPNNHKNTQLAHLDVCRLNYGSANVGQTLYYLFQGQIPSELTNFQQSWDAVYPLIYQYRQSLITIIKQIDDETKQYGEQLYTPLYRQCTQSFLQKLSQQFSVPDIQNMTLNDFVVGYVKNQTGIDINSISCPEDRCTNLTKFTIFFRVHQDQHRCIV